MTSARRSNPQTFNRYVYVLNNPLIFVDPLGLEWRTNDKTGKLAWYGDNDDRAGTTEFIDEYYKDGDKWVHLNTNGPNSNADHNDQYGWAGWTYVDASSVPGIYNPDNLPSIQAGESENTSWFGLTVEYFTGTGPSDRQFGPESDMTRNMQTSPDVNVARNSFINQAGSSPQYGRTYGPTGVRFGLDAEDGPLTAGFNMPRQFVGSFTITITEKEDGDALFVLENTTHLKSLLYQIPGIQPIKGGGPLSNRNQTFWWVEKGILKR